VSVQYDHRGDHSERSDRGNHRDHLWSGGDPTDHVHDWCKNVGTYVSTCDRMKGCNTMPLLLWFSSRNQHKRPPVSLFPFLVPASFLVLTIMSGRVQKRPSSTSRRQALALLIESIGFEVMPCSFCQSRRLKCRMIERTSKCAECTRRGKACDASGVSISAGARFSVPCWAVVLVLTFL
jgi:hypothetical protein